MIFHSPVKETIVNEKAREILCCPRIRNIGFLFFKTSKEPPVTLLLQDRSNPFNFGIPVVDVRGNGLSIV